MEVQTPEYVSSNGRKRRRASARSTSSSADDSNHSTRLIIKDSNKKEIALPNGEPNDTSTGSESKGDEPFIFNSSGISNISKNKNEPVILIDDTSNKASFESEELKTDEKSLSPIVDTDQLSSYKSSKDYKNDDNSSQPVISINDSDFTNKLGGGTIQSTPANVNSNVNNLNSKIVSDDEASANGDQMEIEEVSVHKQPHRAESVIQIDSDDADSDSSNKSFHGFSSDPSAHIFNEMAKFLGRANLKKTKSNSDDLDVVATIRMMGPDDYYVVTDDSESQPGPSGLSKTSQLANKSTSPVVVKEEPVDKDDSRSPARSPNSRLQVKSNAALGIQSDSWNKRKSTDGTVKRKISLNVSDNKLDSTPVAEDGVSLTSSAASTPSQSSFRSESRSSKGKIRPTIDTLDPIFKKPLEMGWRRELVYRNAIDSSNRRNCDVYYYTPQGRKVRSSKEVLDHIDGLKLTLKNFTFAKDTLGTNDPEKEIVRDARRVSGREPSSTPPKKIPKAKPKPVQAKVKMNFDIKTEPDSPAPTSPTVSSLSPLSPNMSPTVLLKRAVIPPGTTTTKSSLFTNYPKIKLSRYVKPVKKKPVTPTPTPSVVAKPPVSNIKIKRQQRSRSSDDDNRENSDDMEMGMLPPTWEVDSAGKKGSGTNKNSWGSAKAGDGSRKRKAGKQQGEGPMTKMARVNSGLTMPRLFVNAQHISSGYGALLHLFQYLKVQELLRAALVDKMWHDLAAHSSLWKTVRLKNSQVHDWEGCSAALSRHQTQHLDLRKMLVPQNTDSMWTEFCKAMAKVDSLERLDLCRCSASTVEQVCSSCTQLKVLNAQAIRCQLMDFEPFQNLSCLEELRLKSVSGIRLKNPLDPICQLTTLRHLALTTFKDLGKQNPSSLGSLVNLESLELGECSDLPANFPEGTLAKLSKLRRLRLEKVQGGECPTFSYLQVIRTLPELVQLELVNFDVKPGFDEELALCTQLTKLLIIPTYVTQSATSNRMVMNGIGHLQERLTHFVWGVTHELLRVTELFVVQCEGKSGRTGVKRTDKKENSIPVLKPVPGDPDSLADDRAVASSDNEEGGGSPDTSPRDEDLKSAIEGMKPPPGTPPQVEIVPLPKLQRILAAALPHTKIKILKIPYHATWRQYLTDKDV